jgi:hypothetical protein
VSVSFLSSSNSGLRDLILAISPPWLRNGIGPGALGEGMGDGRLMYLFGLGGDLGLEKLDQGMRAHMPGYGTATALPLIGDDRVLVQAPGEGEDSFVLRCKSFLRDWSFAGSNWGLLEQVRFYVTPFLPAVRVVSNSGVWDWFASGAPNTDPDGSWIPPIHWPHPGSLSWDDLSSAWWRSWMILFPGLQVVGDGITTVSSTTPIEITTNSAHGLSTGDAVAIDNVHSWLVANGYWAVTVTGADTFTLDGSVGETAPEVEPDGIVYLIPPDALQTTGTSAPQVIGPAPYVWGSGAVWGDGENLSPTSPAGISWGLNVPSSWFGPIRAIAREWKAANQWLRYVVVSFDPSGSFSPWQSSTPTGDWQQWKNRSPYSRYAGGQL